MLREPEVIPLRGPKPTSVLVWPLVRGAVTAPELLHGADQALRRRGYVVRGAAVDRELLVAAGLLALDPTTAEGGAQVRSELSVDAVLVVTCASFAVDVPLRHAAWDCRWQLWSTAGHGLLWEQNHAGQWQQPHRDERSALERQDDGLRMVQFGARSANYRSVAELLVDLHHRALVALPEF